MAELSASQKDNFTILQENSLLQESLKYIKEMSTRLLLTQTCVATASYYFHKVIFY
jgi:hypothetical protein